MNLIMCETALAVETNEEVRRTSSERLKQANLIFSLNNVDNSYII